MLEEIKKFREVRRPTNEGVSGSPAPDSGLHTTMGPERLGRSEARHTLWRSRLRCCRVWLHDRLSLADRGGGRRAWIRREEGEGVRNPKNVHQKSPKSIIPSLNFSFSHYSAGKGGCLWRIATGQISSHPQTLGILKATVIHETWLWLYQKLRVKHSQVRLLAFAILHELFLRSKVCFMCREG